jgi:hypothetical protein
MPDFGAAFVLFLLLMNYYYCSFYIHYSRSVYILKAQEENLISSRGSRRIILATYKLVINFSTFLLPFYSKSPLGMFASRFMLTVIRRGKFFRDCWIKMASVVEILYFSANIKSSYRCGTYVHEDSNAPAIYNLNLNRRNEWTLIWSLQLVIKAYIIEWM